MCHSELAPLNLQLLWEPLSGHLINSYPSQKKNCSKAGGRKGILPFCRRNIGMFRDIRHLRKLLPFVYSVTTDYSSDKRCLIFLRIVMLAVWNHHVYETGKRVSTSEKMQLAGNCLCSGIALPYTLTGYHINPSHFRHAFQQKTHHADPALLSPVYILSYFNANMLPFDSNNHPQLLYHIFHQ